MALVVYGDFSDPLSQVASQRVDVLKGRGAEVEWRAVAARETILVHAQPADDRFDQRYDDVQQWCASALLPGERGLPEKPRTMPFPDQPVAGYAEAVGAGVEDFVRHLIFDAYWNRGVDIGNPAALRHLLVLPIMHGDSPSDILSFSGDAIGMFGGPMTGAAYHLMKEWREAWQALGSPELPVLQDGDTVFAGFDAVKQLGRLLGGQAAVTVAGNPYVLPPMPVENRWLSIPRPGRRPLWWDTPIGVGAPESRDRSAALVGR